jgi:hypothetical protein
MFKTLLVIVLVYPFAVFAGFTEEPQFGTKRTFSVAWGDYDDDGDADILVGNYDNKSYLFVNDGTGGFTEHPQGPFWEDYTRSFAWGDYDNDGDLDFARGNGGYHQNELWVYNGSYFTGDDQFGTGYTTSLSWGDSDNDGDLDLAVGNIGQNYLYVNDGTGAFTEEAQFGANDNSTQSTAWGDCDNDGDLDLAVGNTYENYIYINDGAGGFTEKGLPGDRNTQGIAWGDYDNDGDLDLAEGTSTGQNYLYVNDGTGVFTEEPQFGTSTVYSIAWADFDNDGDLDLALGIPTGQNYIYVNNGAGGFTGQPYFGAHYTQSIAWGDCDNDGDLDLAEGNRADEQNCLYVNGENGDDYLLLHLVGHFHDEGAGFSNRNGIGANVFVYEQGHLGDDDHLLGFREIEANGGYCGQNSMDAEFGLPNDENVDILIKWPGSDGSHIEEAWLGVEKGQRLTLHEGGGSPLDVVLNFFEAEPHSNGILLGWDLNTTGNTEIGGFNLYRSTKSAGEGKMITPRDKLNANLITGKSPYSYLDATVEKGITYSYWLEAVDVGGAAETFGPVECAWRGALPTAYALYQSRPNPATGSATIAFDLPEDVEVTLAVYDINGRKIATVVNETLPAGEHEPKVSGLSPGVYVYRLEAGEFSAARKMVVQ